MLVFCILLAQLAWGRVLVRWTHSAIPSPKALGVNDLVVSWSTRSAPLFEAASKLGYQVYAESNWTQASAAAETAANRRLAGVVIEIQDSEKANLAGVLQKLETAYPKLVILSLNSQGIEPGIRGRRGANKKGLPPTTGPTHQPWIDSNLALIRIEQAPSPLQVPLYSFRWDLAQPSLKVKGPGALDYSLAVAEAGAFHADLVLDLPMALQRGLAQNNPAAWATWSKVKRYLEFWPSERKDTSEPLANVGVVMGKGDSAYEAVNLIARHNIPFRLIRPDQWTALSFDSLDEAVVFAAPEKEQSEMIDDFAAQGGTAIMVNLPSARPWQSAPPLRTTDHSAIYAVGKGRIIELSEPVTDPETFSQEIRRMLDNRKVLINLWNSLTTLAVLYGQPGKQERLLELVNYSGEPVEIQVQVKGSFPIVRYETPEGGCCESLTPQMRDGFIEFEVSHLVIGGRVHLSTAQ
jgi:hypothetical protein